MSTYHWSVHQMTEYFSAVSGHPDEATTMQFAVERAAEALDAECVAVVRHGAAVGQVGLRRGVEVPAGLLHVDAGLRVDLPGLGRCHVTSGERSSDPGDEHLVAARQDEPFTAEERQLLCCMSDVLGLALRNVRILTTERTLRADKEREAEERLRLLAIVRTRERLLEALLAIQQAISERRPLQFVLDAVTAGARGLLDEDVVVALVLQVPESTADGLVSVSPAPTDEQRVVVLRAAAACLSRGLAVSEEDGVPSAAVLAVPVQVAGSAAASLVAVLPSRAPSDVDLLVAFAQQVSTALTDARTLAQVQQAQHDDLTGLPERGLFLTRLDRALGNRTEDEGLTLLFIDLDRFKQVNDSLGHAAGDELLIQVSQRIRSCVRSTDTAARLGGDEFAVLLEGLDCADTFAVADRITAALREPFPISGREVFIACSIGVVQPSPVQRDGATLLNSADVAMYRAKKAGDGRAVLYEPTMHVEARERLGLQGDLQRALGSGQLHLAYQPVIDLADLRPVGVEALLRWTHPERGDVPPSTFIPVAEETGLIVALGKWVLEQSARQLARWRQDFPHLQLNVNVSGRQLQERDFPETVLLALSAATLPVDAVTLELTETVLMNDPDGSLARLARLRALGLRISIDDFGTGYSSLSYLRRLPVDQLKVDRAFVAGLGSDETDAAVVRTVVDLAQTLGLQTVAEGIETAEQLRALQALGCHLGQGYLLCRPLAPAAMLSYLTAAARPLALTREL